MDSEDGFCSGVKTSVTNMSFLHFAYLTPVDSRFGYFSNSLIIDAEKTKEITTLKEIWICDPNYHKIL